MNMNKDTAKKRLAAAILSTILCLGMFFPGPASAENDGSAVTKAIATIIEKSEEGLGYMHRGLVNYLHPTKYIMGCLAQRTIEDLLEQSAVIAIGKVTGQSEPYRISHATNPDWTEIHTDYYFTISNVLKGDPYSETVNVRVEGGTIDNYTEIYDCSPVLNQEDEYLLFLYRPAFGGAFETEGDYYTIRGLVQGTFVLGEDGVYRNIMDNKELPSEVFISPHLDEEVDENAERERQLQVYKENYETGFITQEEYEECVRSMDIYGQIIN